MGLLIALQFASLFFSLFIDSYRGFAGWASDRAWIGLGGLFCWILVPLLLLCLPVRRVLRDVETDPTPVSSGVLGALRHEIHHLLSTSGLSTLFFGAPLLYFALSTLGFLAISAAGIAGGRLLRRAWSREAGE